MPQANGAFPAGCIAILTETPPRKRTREGTGMAMFLTAQHADTHPAATSIVLADMLYWASVVHARSRWKEEPGRRFYTLTSGMRELIFQGQSFAVMELLSVKPIAL